MNKNVGDNKSCPLRSSIREPKLTVTWGNLTTVTYKVGEPGLLKLREESSQLREETNDYLSNSNQLFQENCSFSFGAHLISFSQEDTQASSEEDSIPLRRRRISFHEDEFIDDVRFMSRPDIDTSIRLLVSDPSPYALEDILPKDHENINNFLQRQSEILRSIEKLKKDKFSKHVEVILSSIISINLQICSRIKLQSSKQVRLDSSNANNFMSILERFQAIFSLLKIRTYSSSGLYELDLDELFSNSKTRTAFCRNATRVIRILGIEKYSFVSENPNLDFEDENTIFFSCTLHRHLRINCVLERNTSLSKVYRVKETNISISSKNGDQQIADSEETMIEIDPKKSKLVEVLLSLIFYLRNRISGLEWLKSTLKMTPEYSSKVQTVRMTKTGFLARIHDKLEIFWDDKNMVIGWVADTRLDNFTSRIIIPSAIGIVS